MDRLRGKIHSHLRLLLHPQHQHQFEYQHQQIHYKNKGCPVHNVYFVKYDVTVSFMAQVLDTMTYFVSHVLESGYSDIFWHIL